MRLTWLASAFFAAIAASSLAAEGAGRWWTEDNRGVIEVLPCPEGLCGRLVGLDEPNDDKGQPKHAKNGAPECGMQIMRVHKTDDVNVWDGLITDPRDMTDWNLRLTYRPDGGLHLRGYVMLPLLGKSQDWKRFTGRVNAKCEIAK
jgi:uncharacterized protein (DUF2147 family)